MAAATDGQGGWVLLEVLVALAVLAVALGVLVEAVSSGVKASRTGAARGRAILAGQSVLAELAARAEGKHEGVISDGQSWTAHIRRHSHNPEGIVGLPALMEVTVTVHAPGRPVILTTLGLAR